MAERKYYRKIYQKNKKKLPFILKVVLFSFLFFSFGFSFLFIYYTKELPRPERFAERHLFESTRVYDRTGEILLYEIFGEEKRTWVNFEEIPENLKKAIIATEDSRFYQHSGLDFRGIIRAILVNLRTGEIVQGASTISQQLIRSTFLELERTAERKIREIVLALELERRYSKDQIFEWYLNQVPFGRNTYGVGAASYAYFDKPVQEISLTEAATLASFIRAPSYYSSEKNFEKLLKRRNFVLNRMYQENFISKEKLEKTEKEELKIIAARHQIKAPHFVMYIKDQLLERYSENFLRKEGLKIYTSLDWELQQLAEKVVKEGSERNISSNAHNAALVAIHPKTGEILAMVGSRNWHAENSYPQNCQPGINCLFDPYPNVAIRGRQPGSAFKPFIYAAAFEKGYNDKTIVIDEPSCWTGGNEPWCPQNYDNSFRGPVTLRAALAQSLNIPSVKVLENLVGLEEGIKIAQNFGITTLEDPTRYGLSIVLGGAEVKLLDLVSGYAVFANEGLAVPPLSILKIKDINENIIEENKRTPKRVIKRKSAQLINSILSDNEARAPIFGLNSPMYFKDYQVAVKTGTTQDYRDGWIIGYTPFLSVGVWTGNNNNDPIWREPGMAVAGPIWRAFMEKALIKFPKENFTTI